VPMPRALPATALALALVPALPAAARAPEPAVVVAALEAHRDRHAAHPGDLPERLERRITAWQPAPPGFVLAGGEAPGEPAPYVMTHPAFTLVWRDGGVLLVDAGLTRAGAAEFGRPMDWLGGGPVRCGADPWAGLAAGDVGAAVFTHLHVDHVDGLGALCEPGRPIPVAPTPAQRTSDERFERAGLDALRDLTAAGCVRETTLGLVDPDSPAPALAGFPGVHRVAVPGHTPGSVLWVAFLHAPEAAQGLRSLVIAGDVVNHRAGYRHDIPKPWWYRRLLVREDDALQAAHRGLLARLEAAGFEILVNHHLEVDGGLPDGVDCGS